MSDETKVGQVVKVLVPAFILWVLVSSLVASCFAISGCSFKAQVHKSVVNIQDNFNMYRACVEPRHDLSPVLKTLIPELEKKIEEELATVEKHSK